MKIFAVFVCVFFCVLSTGNAFAGEAKREQLNLLGQSFPEYSIYHHSIKVVKQSASPVMITGAHAIYIPKKAAAVVRDVIAEFPDLNNPIYIPKTYAATVRAAKEAINKKDWWNYNDEGVLISLDATSETAVAVQYGVQIFNSFNEYLGGFTPTSMEPPHHGMSWLYRHSDIFTFKGYGYAFVFIAKARLKDGSIWIYDVEEVRSQIGPKVKRLKLDEE